MFCLDNTDTLEAGASVDAVVDYTVHGLVGSTFTVLADGQLSDTDPTVLYTAGAAISIVCVTFVNTHSSAVTVNLYLDSANAGNPRRMIPKDVSLGIGSSLHFDGQRCSVMDADGNILGGSHFSGTQSIIYRMINNEADGDNDPLGGGGADWEISDDTETENQLGSTGVTEANGIFSFVSTGYWSIRAYGMARLDVGDGNDRFIGLKISASDDASGAATYTAVATAHGSAEDYGASTYTAISCEALLKIETLADDKIKLIVNTVNANTYFAGHATENRTYVVFTKLADI